MRRLLLNNFLNQSLLETYRDKRDQPQSSHWGLKLSWASLKPQLCCKILKAHYHLEPSKVLNIHGHRINQWQGADIVVLKAVYKYLSNKLTRKLLLPGVFSLPSPAGQPKLGVKAAGRKIQHLVGKYRYVYKTDIADFYKTINHKILLNKLPRWLPKGIKVILDDYIDRVETVDAEHIRVREGLPKGGALSPLLGNLYLHDLDKALLRYSGVEFVRYMDDVMVFCNCRAKLQRIVSKVKRVVASLKLKLSKPKTYIGPTETGLHALGYYFKPHQKITVSNAGIQRMKDKVSDLMDETIWRNRRKTVQQRLEALQLYLKRWWIWCKGGLKNELDICGCLQQLKQAVPPEYQAALDALG